MIARLKVESVVHGGEALARHEGRVVFVRGAAPGDLVEAELTGEGRFEHARALRIVQPGAARVEAPCPIVDRCGGCPLQHVSYEVQLAAKQELTADALERIGGFARGSYELRPIVPSPLQFRYRRPVRLPYSGLTKWHYAFGLFFGVLTLTWVFSGMLSLEPWQWTQQDEVLADLDQALTGGSLDLSQFPSIDAPSWKALFGERAIKEVEFARIQGDPYFVIRSSSDEAPLLGAPDGGHQPYFVSRNRDAERLVVAANPLAIRTAGFSTGSITGSLKKALPDVPILETELLEDYDSYYYSRDREVPLPVLRVKFGDPARTWVYIDPEVNQIVGQVQRNNRIERWLYNGLHSLDFSFWYYKRPLWDIGVILLSLGGAALSGMGVLMGFRRIMRAVTRTVRSPAAERATSPVPGLR